MELARCINLVNWELITKIICTNYFCVIVLLNGTMLYIKCIKEGENGTFHRINGTVVFEKICLSFQCVIVACTKVVPSDCIFLSWLCSKSTSSGTKPLKTKRNIYVKSILAFIETVTQLILYGMQLFTFRYMIQSHLRRKIQ